MDTTTGEGEGKFVTCGQGHSFCLECKHEAHAPASCDVVKTWLQKCDDDSETFNWLSANTQVRGGAPRGGEKAANREQGVAGGAAGDDGPCTRNGAQSFAAYV